VTDTEPEDPEGARGLIAAVLAQWVGSVASASAATESAKVPGRTAVSMALIIPTLLARASGESESVDGVRSRAGGEVFAETGARLIEIAAVDPAAFRSVVAGMSEGQKAFMEEVVTSGRRKGAKTGGTGSEGGGQPSIALKMNFGGAE
jgi:HEAT repeat-containing protein 5